MGLTTWRCETTGQGTKPQRSSSGVLCISGADRRPIVNVRAALPTHRAWRAGERRAHRRDSSEAPRCRQTPDSRHSR